MRLLLVKPGQTVWGISDSVEATGGLIMTPASAECPASERAGHSDRFGLKGWQFGNKDDEWVNGDITVTFSSHSYKE